MSVARSWHKLPRETVDVQSLEAFKARLEQGVEQTGLLVDVSAHSRGIHGQDGLRGPFPNHSGIENPHCEVPGSHEHTESPCAEHSVWAPEPPCSPASGCSGQLGGKESKNSGPLAEGLLLETRSVAPRKPLLQLGTGALCRERYRQALKNQSQEKK